LICALFAAFCRESRRQAGGGAAANVIDQVETGAKVRNERITLSLRGLIGERNIRRAMIE